MFGKDKSTATDTDLEFARKLVKAQTLIANSPELMAQQIHAALKTNSILSVVQSLIINQMDVAGMDDECRETVLASIESARQTANSITIDDIRNMIEIQ